MTRCTECKEADMEARDGCLVCWNCGATANLPQIERAPSMSEEHLAAVALGGLRKGIKACPELAQLWPGADDVLAEAITLLKAPRLVLTPSQALEAAGVLARAADAQGYGVRHALEGASQAISKWLQAKGADHA